MIMAGLFCPIFFKLVKPIMGKRLPSYFYLSMLNFGRPCRTIRHRYWPIIGREQAERPPIFLPKELSRADPYECMFRLFSPVRRAVWKASFLFGVDLSFSAACLFRLFRLSFSATFRLSYKFVISYNCTCRFHRPYPLVHILLIQTSCQTYSGCSL